MRNGWRKTALGEVFVTQTGTTPPKNNAEFYGDFMPLVKPPELLDSQFDTAGDSLSEAGAAVARALPPRSILVSCIGNIGKIGMNIVPVAFNQQINAILPNTREAVPEFMFFQALSPKFKEQLECMASGTTVPIVNKSKFNGIEVVLPPLPEQRRIVGILAKAFEGIATAKANAEKNLQNARDLFDSHLATIFIRRREGWIQTTLGSEVNLLSGFPFKSARYSECEDDIRLLRGDNIVQGALRWDDAKRWPASDTDEYKRYRLCAADVVLAMDRPWVKAGLKRAQISSDDLPCLLVQRTARLRCNGSLNNRFLLYLISSNAFTRHILGAQTGIGVPHISGKQINDFRFLKPPLIEQVDIADQLDALAEATRRLETICQQKLTALESLKKSLLHQAFTGHL